MPLWVFVVLVAWPVTELYVFVLVGQQAGWLADVALLGVLSLLGIWLVRRYARSTAEAVRQLAASAGPGTSGAARGTVPGSAARAGDEVLRMTGALLVAVPGYVSAVVGLVLLVAPVRHLARRLAGPALLRRAGVVVGGTQRVRLWRVDGTVVQGTVVDDTGGEGPRPEGEPPALPPGT